MSREANRFRLGVFFFLGALLAISVMVWLTGWFKNEATKSYVCYFSESVQGLEEGSSVRYNGVPVGTVDKIHVAPDGRLVEVVMSIDSNFPVRSDLKARLVFVGITGLRIVDLRRSEAEVTIPPVLAFDPPHPVIPVGQSQLEQLDLSLEGLAEIMATVDFGGISERTVALLENLNLLLERGSVEGLFRSAMETSTKFDTLAVVYTELGQTLMRVSSDMEHTVGPMAEDLQDLSVGLLSLTESLAKTTETANDLMIEAGIAIQEARVLLDRMDDGTGGLFLQKQKEDVWP
jgi:ABC-type transporter Mla subunit MlaD